MSSTRGLIKRSLRLVGAIASGETPSASDEADALESLNAMLGLWSTQGLMLSKVSREVFLTSVGKADYTMGPSGDWDTARPTRILRANYTTPEINVVIATPYDPGDPLADPIVPETPEVTETTILATTEYPIEIIDFERWSQISDKRLFSSDPSKLYVQGTSPLESVSFYPVPNSQIGIVVYSEKALVSVSNAADEFELAPGYEDAVVYNLAVRLAPEFGKQIEATVFEMAAQSLRMVKRANTKPVYAKSDAPGGCRGNFNVYTGE